MKPRILNTSLDYRPNTRVIILKRDFIYVTKAWSKEDILSEGKRRKEGWTPLSLHKHTTIFPLPTLQNGVEKGNVRLFFS